MTTREILILEDEMLIALDIKSTLQEAGFENLVLCNSVEQARQILEKSTPDIALLDINLGNGETSFDIGRELASRDCDIIMMSGYTTSNLSFPEELGAVPRLSKPFEETDLLNAIDDLKK